MVSKVQRKLLLALWEWSQWTNGQPWFLDLRCCERRIYFQTLVLDCIPSSRRSLVSGLRGRGNWRWRSCPRPLWDLWVSMWMLERQLKWFVRWRWISRWPGLFVYKCRHRMTSDIWHIDAHVIPYPWSSVNSSYLLGDLPFRIPNSPHRITPKTHKTYTNASNFPPRYVVPSPEHRV